MEIDPGSLGRIEELMQMSKETAPEEHSILSSFRVPERKIFGLLTRKSSWRIISGKWSSAPDGAVRVHNERQDFVGESIAILGSRNWRDLEISVRFKFLTDTVKPPEGGAIVFCLFKNARNHLSFHFCLYKKKIQLFKRHRGTWSLVGEQDYPFQLHHEYRIDVRSSSGWHECRIEGGSAMRIHDGAIPTGRIGIGGKFCGVEFSHVSVRAA